jgi:hypothetical protein
MASASCAGGASRRALATTPRTAVARVKAPAWTRCEIVSRAGLSPREVMPSLSKSGAMRDVPSRPERL